MNRQHDGNILTIGESSFEMPFRIRQVIEDSNMTFVLLSIPGSDNEIRNVYGFCDEEEIWQVESLNDKYPDRKNRPFEDISLIGDGLLGRDFYGRRYLIDLMTGAIIRQAPGVK